MLPCFPWHFTVSVFIFRFSVGCVRSLCSDDRFLSNEGHIYAGTLYHQAMVGGLFDLLFVCSVNVHLPISPLLTASADVSYFFFLNTSHMLGRHPNSGHRQRHLLLLQ